MNPYMPSWEYVPDGEPHVYGDRVYVYGSHDRFNGHVYCLNDYICYSAPVDDLTQWRYEGVIYRRTDDPDNRDGEGCLFAPDVTQGPDGRWYLYYVLNNRSDVGVAVCDSPAGTYEYYGHVHYPDGTRLGQREGDEPQFDPAVLTEGDVTYLYTGFCPIGDRSRSGPQATVLDKDMLTILEAPVILMPSEPYCEGSGYEGHAFFEAPSIRKHGDTYVFVYSSIKMYELCYATSKHPREGFTYGGVIIANNDIGIGDGKPVDKPMYYGGNNHGGMECIDGAWYIFYHRHTNGINYCRQACAEPIEIAEDGSIAQVPMTSTGLRRTPFEGEGRYPAYMACHLFTDVDNTYTGGMGRNGFWMDATYPKITQDGRDGDKEEGYIFNFVHGSTAGFRSFALERSHLVGVETRGYGSGVIEVRTEWDGEVLGSIPIHFRNEWHTFVGDVNLPDGTHDLYLSFRGSGHPALRSFVLERKD